MDAFTPAQLEAINSAFMAGFYLPVYFGIAGVVVSVVLSFVKR